MTASNEHLGGEEWRDLDKTLEAYNPDLSASTLTQARENIESYRKEDCQLRFIDRKGNPVRGLKVEAEHIRHSFPFGEQLWPLDAMVRDNKGNGERARTWKRLFTDVFNSANNLCYWAERPRNDASKTEEYQGEQRVENFAETVDWTLANNMQAKGHPLFWSIPKCVPDWVKRYDYETRMKFAEVRVRNLVSRFKGKVTIWDAVNEPMWEPVFKNLDQRNWPHIEPLDDVADMIAEVLRWCREEDPNATYLVNDYGLEVDKSRGNVRGSDGSKVTAASQRKRFCELMKLLDQRGAAPDALGLQSHIGLVTDHSLQFALYDEFAETGLPVHITEFWANFQELRNSGKFTDKDIEEMENEYIANFLTCAFGHPAIEGFYFWGFMGKAVSWRGDYTGHELKPIYHKVKDLIHNQWSTHASLETDDNGVVAFRGFHGVYDLSWKGTGDLRNGTRFTLNRGQKGTQEILLPGSWVS